MSTHMNTHITSGIGHFDVCGPDLGALQQFYAGVFGWQIARKGAGLALASTPAGTPDGALVEAEAPSLTVGIIVADLDAALAEAVARGGRVARPAADNGWVRKAMIADPAGNHLTVIEA